MNAFEVAAGTVKMIKLLLRVLANGVEQGVVALFQVDQFANGGVKLLGL